MSEELAFTDPKRWEQGEFDWPSRVFYTVDLPCLFGKPRKLFEAVQQLKAEIATKEYEILDEGMLLMETGLLKGKLYCQVRRPADYDASIVELEKSKVLSEVHHGPMAKIDKTAKELAERVLKQKGIKPTRTLFWDFRHGPELTGQRADRFVVFCLI